MCKMQADQLHVSTHLLGPAVKAWPVDSWNKIVCSDLLSSGQHTHGTEQVLIGLPGDS